MKEPLPGEMSAAEAEESEESGDMEGYSVVMNCYRDGTHDVFRKPLEAATEAEYPDGLFGLGSIEEALKGAIALTQPGAEYSSPGRTAMLEEYSE